MTDAPVLIVGAGPTGLVLALWLTKLGVRVRIIDRTSEPGTTSRAVAVQARTLELYRQIGLADDVVRGGVEIAAINLWVRGARKAHAVLGAMGKGLSPFPYALIYPQDAHERLLIGRLAALGVSVERRTELASFDQDGTGVRAVVQRPDGSSETVQTRYIAGCDGARSRVRETLGTGFPGGTYAGIFYVADVIASGAAVNREIHVDIETADFLALFPLKGSGEARLIGPANVDAADVSFADIVDRARRTLNLAVTRLNWLSTYKVHHRVTSRFRTGRAFLVGDAAHVHSPVGGQGMNTGIGDAINLAWKLAAVVKGDSAESLLDTYEAERMRFARRLVASTDRAFTVITSPGPIARVVRTRIAPLVIALAFRFRRLRRFMFRVISQIDVEYRDSPLSDAVAGGVHGGDRLPWVEISGTTDNFAPLASLRWQMHVYGEPASGVAEACTELGIPLQQFAWQEHMASAGLLRSAIYLVRPDGYVALADASGDCDRLRQYVGRLAPSPVAAPLAAPVGRK